MKEKNDAVFKFIPGVTGGAGKTEKKYLMPDLPDEVCIYKDGEEENKAHEKTEKEE